MIAERFRDVAGLTGLVYALAQEATEEAAKRGLDPGEALAEVVEGLGHPSSVLYALSSSGATEGVLSREQGAFLYEEAQRLLTEAGATPREEGGELRVSQDELLRAYAYLAGKHEEDWEGFILEAKAALASRFPEYAPRINVPIPERAEE